MAVQSADTILVRRINGVRWWVRPSFLGTPGFESLTRIGADWHPEARTRKEWRRKRWSSVYQSGATQVFLKYYLPRSGYERFKYLVRPSRASAEWRNARLLESLGVRVPELLAWGERRGLAGWRQSLLVTEALPDAPTLLEWSECHSRGEDVRALRRRLARNLAMMHEHGLFHRDLHGDNVLVVDEKGAAIPCLLDFHEMLRLPRPVTRFCVDDLARLNGFVEASLWQRVRFLHEYLEAREIHRSQARDWIVAVDRATRALWAHYAGKGQDFRRYT